ncbi:MAG: glycosyltransferase family 4 protein [Acidobacteriota bacterium]
MPTAALTIVHVTEATSLLREPAPHVLAAAAGLAARGHHVVLVSRPDATLAGACSEAGVVHVPMPLRHRLDLASARRLARMLDSQSADVVHAHGVAAPAVAVAASHWAPGPALFVDVDTSFPVSWRARLVLRSRKVRRIVTGSEALRLVVTTTGRLDPARVAVVWPGVDSAPATPTPPDPPTARGRLGISVGTPVVVQVGAHLWQGWRELLHAVPAIRAQVPTVLLVIAGCESPGQRRAVLRVVNEMGLREAVRVLPPGVDPLVLIAASDVVVDASWAGRGFPWALARAMQLGRPIVATSIAGAGELVEDGVSGILVPAREAPTLAAAVARLLRDADLAAGMGLAGQLRTHEEYSLATSTERLETLYRTVLAGEATRP